jgi:predicted Zn-dependent protease with MMP-like domain
VRWWSYLAIGNPEKRARQKALFSCHNKCVTEISDSEFQQLVDQTIERLPKVHKDKLKNLGFFIKDQPSQAQLSGAGVRQGGLLLGLYEGVPLPQRQGSTGGLPDKITLFKEPLLAISHNLAHLKANIHNTVWHEVAHYFGLDHDRIHQIESNHNN